jgi:dUTPase
MVFCQFSQAIWMEEELLSDTERGEAGFGSTGKK